MKLRSTMVQNKSLLETKEWTNKCEIIKKYKQSWNPKKESPHNQELIITSLSVLIFSEFFIYFKVYTPGMKILVYTF